MDSCGHSVSGLVVQLVLLWTSNLDSFPFLTNIGERQQQLSDGLKLSLAIILQNIRMTTDRLLSISDTSQPEDTSTCAGRPPTMLAPCNAIWRITRVE
eukprot:872094-Amphidinium_carterae.1